MFGTMLEIDGAIDGNVGEVVLGMELNALEMQQQQQQQLERERAAERQREIEFRRQQEAIAMQREAEAHEIAYVAHMQAGLSLVQANNFIGALQQFNSALQQKPSDIQARFNIAVCTKQLGNVREAFDIFTQLQSDSSQLPQLEAQLHFCTLNLTNAALVQLQRGYSHLTANQFTEARFDLNAARACIAGLPQNQVDNQIDDFNNQLSWYEMRPNIDSEFQNAKQQIALQQFRTAKQLLENVAQKYSIYAKYLSPTETANATELSGLLQTVTREVEKLDNIERQSFVTNRMPLLEQYVANYQLNDAFQTLNDIYSNVHHISHPEDVVGYINLNVIEADIQTLNAFSNAFDQRRNVISAEIAQNIAATITMQQTLSEYDLTRLKKLIKAELQQQWIQLDRLVQNSEHVLCATLIDSITTSLRPNDCITACCVGATHYIDFSDDQLTAMLNGTITNNLPQGYRAPIQLGLISIYRKQTQGTVPFLPSQNTNVAPSAQVAGAPVVQEMEYGDFDLAAQQAQGMPRYQA